MGLRCSRHTGSTAHAEIIDVDPYFVSEFGVPFQEPNLIAVSHLSEIRGRRRFGGEVQPANFKCDFRHNLTSANETKIAMVRGRRGSPFRFLWGLFRAARKPLLSSRSQAGAFQPFASPPVALAKPLGKARYGARKQTAKLDSVKCGALVGGPKAMKYPIISRGPSDEPQSSPMHCACTVPVHPAAFLWWRRRAQRRDCLAGHVRLELRNVTAKYLFERSLRFPEIDANPGHRDFPRLSCDLAKTQLALNARISAAIACAVNCSGVSAILGRSRDDPVAAN
jgi:hypothetical protein